MPGLVSILMPTFNRVDVIEKTVLSALGQTHSDIEVVVVDNASTDGTWELLGILAEGDPRLRIFRNPENLGPVRNWLACVANARGEYAKILWSDDLIAPTFVERCLPHLLNEDVAFVYTSALMFSGVEPQDDDVRVFQLEGSQTVVMGSHAFVDGIMSDGDFPFSPGCAIFRMEDLRRNLWPQIPNRVGSDFTMHAIGNDLLLFLLTANERKYVVLVGEPLSYFRDHKGSLSVLAGKGRLHYHYDMAKAYFCSEVRKDWRLQRRLNAHIWLHLRRYGEAPYGMRRVQDFYLNPGRQRIGATALLTAVMSLVRRRLLR